MVPELNIPDVNFATLRRTISANTLEPGSRETIDRFILGRRAESAHRVCGLPHASRRFGGAHRRAVITR